VAILNDVARDIHGEFIDLVKKRRDSRVDLTEADLFSGKIWSGRRARELGLIDGIGDIHSVLRTKYGKGYELKYITEPASLLSSLKKAIGLEAFAAAIVTAAYSRICGDSGVQMRMT
jgi:ClpP class serine protease